MKSLSDKAYAKINLSLDIVGTLPNGYHELKNVMQTVSLYDEVAITLRNDSTGIRIFCDTDNVPLDDSNICHKAARLFFEAAGITEYGVDISITKNIPSMAGLGGGSSDGAAVLRILNRLYNGILCDEEIIKVAAFTGADVPFLVKGGLALCEGIGEKLTHLKTDKVYNVVLIKPDMGISTPEAYRLFDKKRIKTANASKAIVAAIERNEDISSLLSNDLENAVDSEEIKAIKTKLADLGADGTLMTGSGSCVYGLFSSYENAVKAEKILSKEYGFTKLCKTI